MFSNDVWGEGWIECGSLNDGSVMYYHKDSVKKSAGTINVWNIWRYGDKFRSDIVAKIKQDDQFHGCEELPYEDFLYGIKALSYEKSLFEIRCEENLSRICVSIYYDSEGVVIADFIHPEEWLPIVSDTIEYVLKNILCE